MSKNAITTPEATTEPVYKTMAELDAEDSTETTSEQEQEEEEPAPDPTKTDEPEKESEDEEENTESDEEESGDTEEDDEDLSIFKDVDALHGEELEVDYEGVDPLSPEGIFKREQAIEARSIDKWEEVIKERAPRHYAYLLHGLNGGKDEEFFEKTQDLDGLPSEDDIEVDEDLQRQVIERNLRSKGNSDKHIKAILKAAAEDDELEEMAKEALAEEKTKAAKVLESIENQTKEAQEIKNKDIQEMTGYVDQVVTSGKIGKIAIPDKDRKAFAEAFKQGLRYDNGKFFSVTELNADNIEAAFQKEYFQFKKGDLAGLVERQAKTENTRRLKRSINTTPKPKSTESSNSRGMSLGEL